MPNSPLERRFLRLWCKHYPDLPLVYDQVKPIPNRRFRLDFAHVDSLVGIEISGGIWHKGGHSSGRGLMRDYEKMNLSQMHGWIVFQLSSEQITTAWCKCIEATIKSRTNKNLARHRLHQRGFL